MRGLIASPPCPQFSNAGSGHGRRLLAELRDAIGDVFHAAMLYDAPCGMDVATEHLARHRLKMAEVLYDARVAEGGWPLSAAERLAGDALAAASEALLMAQPARWIPHLTQLEWVAMEQVPAALPLFECYVELLRGAGWRSAWAGVLSAEQYGVPQTRRRAVLIAHRVEVVQPPDPTHQRYEPGVAAGAGEDCEDTLFGPGLLPWVSMAEALGWGMSARPALTFAPGTASGGGADPVGGSRAREVVEREQDAGRWVAQRMRGAGMLERHGDRRGRELHEPAPALTATGGGHASGGFVFVRTGQNSRTAGGGTEIFERDVEAPAPTVTGQARSWALVDRQPHGAERRADEPAPTILASHDNGNKMWVADTGRQPQPGITQQRPVDQPAPTVTATSGDGQWQWKRPATTVMGDPSLWPPGYKINADDIAAGRDGGRRARGDTYRLTIEQAAALQSFPLGYAFVGTKTSQFQQVGNAIPPLLAWHVLRAVTGLGAP